MKKLIWAVVVAIVAVVALVWGIKRSGIVGDAEPPPSVTGNIVEKVDMNTGELMEKTFKEWEKLGREEDRYKNPETGKYTMAIPILCGSCGAKIAPPPSPPDPYGTGLPLARAMAEYRCPKCGNPVAR